MFFYYIDKQTMN